MHNKNDIIDAIAKSVDFSVEANRSDIKLIMKELLTHSFKNIDIPIELKQQILNNLNKAIYFEINNINLKIKITQNSFRLLIKIIIDEFIKFIISALIKNHVVIIKNLGKFTPTVRNIGAGVCPFTNKPQLAHTIQIIKFTVSQTLKKLINGVTK